MAYLVYSLVCSSVLLVIVASLLYGRYGARSVVAATIPLTLIFMCLFAPAVALQALLTAGVAGVCLLVGARPRTLFFGALGAAGVTFAVVAATSASRLYEIRQLRHDYPLVSLADRLAYEGPGEETANQPESAIRGELAVPVQTHLVEFEQRNRLSWRGHMLRQLHERTTTEFVLAPDFGYSRMPRVSRGLIVLPEPDPIPLPSASEEYSPNEQPPVPQTAREAARPADVDRLFALHESGASDLLDPDRMGYVRDRNHVAGFQSHQFSRMPSLGSPNCSGGPASTWHVVRLELIGLLRHETPVAYVSENLPKMDELAAAKTRPLGAFETAALEKLRRDEDVVTQQSAQRIQMVGSLRAGSDCLECHTARRGELLGALSYELRPLGAPRVPKQPESAKPQARRETGGRRL